MSNFDLVLEDCLDHVTHSKADVNTCLARYPEFSTELRPLLTTAVHMQAAGKIHPSPEFKSRGRAKLIAYMREHPRRQPVSRGLFVAPAWRLAASTFAILIALMITGTAYAQSALPGDVFYPWKLTSEQVWHAISPDPVGTELLYAERRVNEAIASSSNSTAQETALQGYQETVIDLGEYTDPVVQERIEINLEIQEKRLDEAGLLPLLPDKDKIVPIPIPDKEVPSLPDPDQDVPSLPAP